MSNHRPISLITTFSKALEKAVHNRLTNYLQTSNTLVPEQCGFRKGISAENTVLKSINQKMHVGGTFCDLAKAFDYVNHKILLTKYIFLAFMEQQQVGLEPT
jgi:hypothetical protein